MKRTPLQRKTRLNPVSKKNVTRTGKLGIVRLRGKDLEDLRQQCFDRDGWRCKECGCIVYRDFDVFENPFLPRAEMAHIGGKRNHGDTLSNVRTLCIHCHYKEHTGELHGKPVPAKPKEDKLISGESH